jgi:hypothetical protein
MSELPVCPTCGEPFDEEIEDRVAKVTVFGHAGDRCSEVYGRESDQLHAGLVRLGTLDDYYIQIGALTIGRGSPTTDKQRRP